MWLDAAFVDQPGEHLSRAITGIGHQTRRRDLEALGGALDHLGRRDFRLTHTGVGLHIRDHRVFEIDQIVVGMGIDRGPACPFSIGAVWCQALSGSSVDLAVMSLAGSSLLFGIGMQALP